MMEQNKNRAIKPRTRKIRKIAISLLMLVCLTGCASEAGTPSATNGTPGTKTEVPLAQIMERQENGEQMLVLFVQDGCSYCADFDAIVDTYLETHNITLNVVNLTTEEAYNPKENILSALQSTVGSVEQTPALYYIESKDSVHLLDYTEGDYTMDSFTAFLKKHQLDS